MYPKWEAADAIRDGLEGMGYGGITHIGGGRKRKDGEQHRVYISIFAEQIKSVDNLNPTSNPDIRYATDNLGLPNGRYDYSKPFAEQIEDYKNGRIPKGDTLVVGATPYVFRKIGLSALPMTMNTTHVDYSLNGTKDFDRHLGEALLKQLPEAIQHPVAIMTSGTRPNSSIVAMLEIRHNGK